MIVKTSRKIGPRKIDSKTLLDEYVAKELSRRQLVGGMMFAGAGIALGGCTEMKVIQQEGTPPGETPPGEDPNNPDGTTNPDPTKPPPGKHLTGMGYDASSRSKALEAALAETVGLSQIKAGQSVYLRVNANSGDLYPYSTSPDTLLRIGGLLKEGEKASASRSIHRINFVSVVSCPTSINWVNPS